MTNTNAAEVQNYVLPVGEIIHASWRISGCSQFEPTTHQTVLMDAVRKAQEEGKFYNTDINERVAEILGVTPEQRSINTINTCGGDFGYDVYFAGIAVRAQDSIKENSAILKQMVLCHGDLIGTLIFNDSKIVRLVRFESLDENNKVILVGSRGPKPVRFITDPVYIKSAIDRASENGKRKTNYVEFVSAREIK